MNVIPFRNSPESMGFTLTRFQNGPNNTGGDPIEELMETIIFDNFGNVGIGTRTPTEKLDVMGRIKTLEFQLTEGNLNGYVMRCQNDGTAYWGDPSELNDGDWSVNDDNIFVLNPKKVGIGTSTPSEMLHLTGNFIVQGVIKGARNELDPLTLFAGTNTDDGGVVHFRSKFINDFIDFAKNM